MKYEDKEIVENGITYIVRTFESGSVAKWAKHQVPTVKDVPQQVQRGHCKISGTSIAIGLGRVDPGTTSVSVDVQGTDESYVYVLDNEALKITFARPVSAFVNWEVRP